MKNVMGKKPAVAAHRAHAFYSGRVQGIGFRHLTEEIAHRIGVRGFVKNLRDGRVEVVCEGPKDRIDAFLKEILGGPLGRHVQKCDCRWEDPCGEFTDFTVEFYF